MKKLLLFLLFIFGITNAQIVNIPDVNFKAKLLSAGTWNNIALDQFGNTMRIDSNNDSEIQVSEAQAVYKLHPTLYGGPYFTDITGILSFSNLKSLNIRSNKVVNLNLNGLNLESLDCSFCNLSTLDISTFSNLKELNCDHNNLTSLNLTSVPNLETLICRYNDLTALDLQYVPNLHYLNCQENYISVLNLSYISKIEQLLCDGNHLTSLDLSNVFNLKLLGVGYNQITNLDLNNVPNLEDLGLYNCQLTSLDLSKVPNLMYLTCNLNHLTALDLTNLPNLKVLWCSDNLLTSLNLDGNPNLEGLDCSDNQITSILQNNPHNKFTYIYFSNNFISTFNFNNSPNLNSIKCNNNYLTSLNLSNLIGLYELDCSVNNLTELFVKNGKVEPSIDFSNNPNLKFICADEGQVMSIQDQLNSLGMNSTVCNSYCSFTPGGDYNTITGNVHFDSDNNCDENDVAFSNLKITIDDGTTTGAMFENSLGVYKTYVQKTNIILTPSFESPDYFTVTPTSVALNALEVNGITQTQGFCVSANGVHNDVEVVVVPIGMAQPGFDAVYKIVYKNKGNQILSGAVNYTFDDAVLDYVSASVLPNTQATGNLTWNYTDLLPFETRSFTVTLNINGPMETPPVNDGDVLNYSATINPVSGDEIPSDNVFELHQQALNSLDPNDIICLEGNTVSPAQIGEYLHYVINFENIGTASAVNIVVKDIIDTAKYDIASLQVLDASHEVDTRIAGNKVEFVFENINLEGHEHGNVVFKIKSKSTLQTGDSVTNKADIFFDYNFPVITNNEITMFQALGTQDFSKDSSIQISPNPSYHFVNLKADSNIKRIQVYDVQGRVINVRLANDLQTQIDVSDYTNGVYFFKVETEKGIKIEKIIKE